jgi:predicted PurR-regulated permease PerM
MRRRLNWQEWLFFGSIGPIVAINLWLISQIFRYFELLLTLSIVSAVFAFLLNFPVRFLEKRRLSHGRAIALVLLVTVAVAAILGVTVLPNLITQTSDLLAQTPQWFKAIDRYLTEFQNWSRNRNLPIDIDIIRTQINSNLGQPFQGAASQAVTIVLGTISGLLNSVLVAVFTAYMLIYGRQLWRDILNILPRQYALPIGRALQLNFQNFLVSQIVLGIFMTLVLTPIFIILQVPFALPFAIVIGLSQLIPFIGATIGIGIVTIIITLSNPSQGLWVAFFAIVIQQVKDNIIAPKLMGDFTGLNPLIILIVILLGAQMAGILGVFLAVPIAGTINSAIGLIRLQQKSRFILDSNVNGDENN